VSTTISTAEPFRRPKILPARPVTSRVAEILLAGTIPGTRNDHFNDPGNRNDRNGGTNIRGTETLSSGLESAPATPGTRHQKAGVAWQVRSKRYRLMLDSSEMGSVISIARKQCAMLIHYVKPLARKHGRPWRVCGDFCSEPFPVGSHG
jgi:hypothetical protein